MACVDVFLQSNRVTDVANQFSLFKLNRQHCCRLRGRDCAACTVLPESWRGGGKFSHKKKTRTAYTCLSSDHAKQIIIFSCLPPSSSDILSSQLSIAASLDFEEISYMPLVFNSSVTSYDVPIAITQDNIREETEHFFARLQFSQNLPQRISLAPDIAMIEVTDTDCEKHTLYAF